MSNVTNIIISIEGIDFSAEEKLIEVNSYFIDGMGFGSIVDGRFYPDLIGGEKNIEADIAIGAFNYIEIDGLVQHILRIDWPGPASVQLLIKKQENSLFESLVIIDKGWDD